MEEARNVARDLRLPTWWLNEQASAYISGKDDPGKRRVFDLLAEMIGVDSATTAMQICAGFFPDEDITPRSAAVIQELFG